MPKKQPIFLEIADKLQQRVANNVYVHSQKLPSEYELANDFGVSRLTVRKAIEHLVKQNVLVKRKGYGTYVMQDSKIQSGKGGLLSFSETAKLYNKTSQTELLKFEKLVYDEQLWSLLQADKDEVVWRIVRLRKFDQDPMTVENICIRARYLGEVTPQDLVGSLFKLIERQSDIAYSHQEVQAAVVDQKLATNLQVPVGEAILVVKSMTYAANGTPLFYDVSHYRADKYTFKVTLQR